MKRYKFKTQYNVGGVWYEKGSTHELPDAIVALIEPVCIQEEETKETVLTTEPQKQVEEIEIEDYTPPTAAEKEQTKPVKRIRKK